VLECLLKIMKDVLISGFGKFCVREKLERRGRNPVTGDVLMLAARQVVRFKCSSKRRDKCNEKNCEAGD
jgi:integration host factor subunit alpha